jgi:hypothetical protein
MARPDSTSTPTASPEVNAALTAWGDWGSEFFRNMRSWNEEVTHFVGRRLEHDGRTLERLAHCADAGEMARLQQQWMSEAADQYLQEGRRLTEIAMNGAGATIGRAGPDDR